jgi:hypothetical protein
MSSREASHIREAADVFAQLQRQYEPRPASPEPVRDLWVPALGARLRHMYARTPIRYPVQITKHIITKHMRLPASKVRSNAITTTLFKRFLALLFRPRQRASSN